MKKNFHIRSKWLVVFFALMIIGAQSTYAQPPPPPPPVGAPIDGFLGIIMMVIGGLIGRTWLRAKGKIGF